MKQVVKKRSAIAVMLSIMTAESVRGVLGILRDCRSIKQPAGFRYAAAGDNYQKSAVETVTFRVKVK